MDMFDLADKFADGWVNAGLDLDTFETAREALVQMLHDAIVRAQASMERAQDDSLERDAEYSAGIMQRHFNR